MHIPTLRQYEKQTHYLKLKTWAQKWAFVFLSPISRVTKIDLVHKIKHNITFTVFGNSYFPHIPESRI